MLVGLDSGQIPRFGAVKSSDELQMLRPRMRRLKDFEKHSLLHIHVSLRRRDRDVSQQLLDGAQIATLSQEMGRPAATALADGYRARIRARAAAIRAEFRELRLAGEIATMADEELQAGERVRALYIEAGDPDVELLDMWLAGRLDVAQRFDRRACGRGSRTRDGRGGRGGERGLQASAARAAGGADLG
jgi:hypothetical protein